MTKPTYEELEKKVKELELEKLKRDSINNTDIIEVPELSNIINSEEIQSIMDNFCNLTGMVTAILDLKGNIIESTGWQDICTKFHRLDKRTAEKCTSSDLYLSENLKPGEYKDYKCKNGLWDVATPLYLADKHLGNIYTGQFFYDDEEINEDFFIKQADKYGFDRKSYMEAFRKVPVYNRDTIKNLMEFLVKFTTYISKIGFAKIQLEREVLERKKAEAERERLITAIDQAGEMVLITDELGVIQYINPAFEKTTGYSRKEVLGKTPGFLKSGEHRKSFYEDLWKTISAGNMWKGRFVNKRKDGSLFTEDASITPVFNTSGKIVNYVGVKRDITDQIRMEKKVFQNQKMESIGILAGGIAHDFNNLLSIIIGNTSYILSKTDSNDDNYNSLLDIKEGAMQATTMTQQLLTFSKGGEPVKKLTDINEILKESALFVTRGTNSSCCFVLNQNLWKAEVDKGQFNQVVSNLIINANQSMPKGGTITIKTENRNIGSDNTLSLPEGQYIKISIKDQGTGIMKEHLPNIFDPYFSTKQKGSGLGLATTYSIIKKHGGNIFVYSEIEKGTSFKIYLPASMGTRVHSIEIKEVSHTGNGKILIMDDQELILKMVQKMLKSMGYETFCAEEGETAVEIFRKAFDSGIPFDVVILDLTVPGGLGGIETLKEMVKIDPDVKAVVSSGYSNNPVMANYKDYGFRSIIPKPFTKSQLSEVLSKIVS